MARNLNFYKHKPLPLSLRNTSANPVLKPFSNPNPGPFPYLYRHDRCLDRVPDLKPVPNSNPVPDTNPTVSEPVLKPLSVPNPNPVPDTNPTVLEPVLKPLSVPNPNPVPDLNPVLVHDTNHTALEPVLKPVSIPNSNPVPDSNPIPDLNPAPDTNPTMDTVFKPAINSELKPGEDPAIQPFVQFCPEVIIDSFEAVAEPFPDPAPVPRRTSWWRCCGLCDLWRKK